MKGVERFLPPSERVLTHKVLCSTGLVKRFMEFFLGGGGVSACYEEAQNNKCTESVSRYPHFNVRCGREDRAKAVVCFSERRLCVT